MNNNEIFEIQKTAYLKYRAYDEFFKNLKKDLAQNTLPNPLPNISDRLAKESNKLILESLSNIQSPMQMLDKEIRDAKEFLLKRAKEYSHPTSDYLDNSTLPTWIEEVNEFATELLHWQHTVKALEEVRIWLEDSGAVPLGILEELTDSRK